MKSLAAPGAPDESPLLAEAMLEARKGGALLGQLSQLLDARARSLGEAELREVAEGIDALAIRARVLCLEAAIDALAGRPGFAEACAELRTLAWRCGEVLDRVRKLQRGEKLARRTSSMPAPEIRPSTIS